MTGTALPDDRELARLMVEAQAGDRAAYARVLRGCVGVVAAIGAAGGSRTPPDETTVASFLRTIHAARHTFHPKRSFVGWVTAIACHHGLPPDG